MNKIEEKKGKAMSTKIIISVLVENGKNMVLLGLADTWTSKTLGKTSCIKNMTRVKYEEMKKSTKQKTKARTFTTK